MEKMKIRKGQKNNKRKIRQKNEEIGRKQLERGKVREFGIEKGEKEMDRGKGEKKWTKEKRKKK